MIPGRDARLRTNAHVGDASRQNSPRMRTHAHPQTHTRVMPEGTLFPTHAHTRRPTMTTTTPTTTKNYIYIYIYI